MPNRRRIYQVGLLLLALSAGRAQAQNLVSNPNFDASLAGWTQLPSGSWQFDSTHGSPDPGSALGTNTSSQANFGFTLHQCLTVTPGRVYRFGTACRVLLGQSNTGGCGSTLYWHPSPGCAGSTMAYAHSPTIETPGVWADSQGTGVAPPAAASVQFRLRVTKYEAGGSLQARLDSAYVHEEGVPVRGDFDGDRHADLVLHNTVTGEDRLWSMNGVVRLASTLIDPQVPSSYSIVGSDDFNQDGKSDLLLRANTTGGLQIWYMDGASQLPYPYGLGALTKIPAPGWVVAATGDFDHDARPDLLLRKVLNSLSPVEAMELMLERLAKTKANRDFLDSMSGG